MRTLVLVSILAALAAVAAAQRTDPICPTIEIIGPSGLTNPGDTLTFAVTLSSTPANVRYVWNVSRGVIEDGQGTRSIVIRTSLEDHGQNVEATVSITGLPKNCVHKATEIAPVASLVEGQPVDQFGILPRNDIRGRLDNYFHELSNNPHDRGFVVIQLGPGDNPNLTNSRYRLIVQHVRFRKFDLSRIDFGFELGGETGTTLWRVPPGARLPKCRCIYLRK